MNKTWPEDTTRKAANNQTATNIWIDDFVPEPLANGQDPELAPAGSSGLKQQLPPGCKMLLDPQSGQSADINTNIPKDEGGSIMGALSEFDARRLEGANEIDLNDLDKYLGPVKMLIEKFEVKVQSGEISISSCSSLTSITSLTEIEPELRAMRAVRLTSFQENLCSMLITNDLVDLVDQDAMQIAHKEMQEQLSTSGASAASTGRKSRVIRFARIVLQKLNRGLKYFSIKHGNDSDSDSDANDNDSDDSDSDSDEDEKVGKSDSKTQYKRFSNPMEDDEIRPSILYNTLHSLAKLIRLFKPNRKNRGQSPKSPKDQRSRSSSRSLVAKPLVGLEEWDWIVWHLCNYGSKTLRARMPDDEITVVSMDRGRTLRQALARSLKQRHFDPELCTVYQSDTNRKLDWDMDVASLVGGTEIRVESDEKHLTPTKISHNFVRRTYFTVTFCENCNAAVFHGFGCDFCGAQFHRCCAQSMPTLDQPLRVNNYYREVMAINLDSLHPLNEQFNAGKSVSTERVDQVESRSISGSRLELPPMRSISSPEFCMNGTVATIDTDGRIRSPQLVYHHYPVNNESESNLALDLERFFGRLPEIFLVNNKPRSQSQSCLVEGSNDASGNRLKIAGLCEKTLRTKKDWEIGYETVSFGKIITSGSFGAVYTGTYNRTPVAFKKLRITWLTAEQKRRLKRDIEALYKLNHLNLVKLIGCLCRPFWTLVIEWCRGRTLYRFLHIDKLQLEAEEMLNIAGQIAEGMHYLHSKLIIHRSLKSTNIFLHDDFVVKISDYGLPIAKLQWNGIPDCILPNGIDLWMAPEVIRTTVNDPFTTKSDVYSFGIVLFEMCTGHLPFSGISEERMIQLVGRHLLRPELYLVRREHTPVQYVVLMKKCLLIDFERRPSFAVILKHLEAIDKTMPKMCKHAGSIFDLRPVAKKEEDDPDQHDQHEHYHYGPGKKCALYKRMKFVGFEKSSTFEPFCRLANSKRNNDTK